MITKTYQSPQVVAKQLDISPASLRRWSDEFTEFLSKGAGADKERSHRRYVDNDVETLTEIKELMNSGMTYEQVRQQLKKSAVPAVEPDGILENGSVEVKDNFSETLAASDNLDNYPASNGTPDTPKELFKEASEKSEDSKQDPATVEENMAMVAANGSESSAITFLNNTLSTLSESQKSVLNSQAANRELMGVLLQDNFNLKEENNRLRERILEVERDVARTRQEDEWRREALRQELDAKVSAANQLASEAIVTARSVESPQIKAVETKPGCLGMFLGRGGTQIITTQPRKPQQHTTSPAAGFPGSTSQQPPPPAQNHPKPMAPPE